MSCGCSLCLVRAGGPPPKLDGCRCPDQVHVSMMCFVTRGSLPKKIVVEVEVPSQQGAKP